ncbi:MAG: tRNA pseudouridine(55) synthase TruB [Clostridia bacterium]|nr:tRNA pseudouridine(55) synthase TruB [Clostridia bacterium]
MNGILNVLKPPGMTSHDVVNFIRKLTKVKKVGHTGTLDPLACGVLPVCLGRATKIIEYLPSNKTYRAEITLGQKTDSGDLAGRFLTLSRWLKVSRLEFEQALEQFRGWIKQIPPMTSAVHYQGKKLYELARRGLEVEREARLVEITNLELIVWQPPKVLIEVGCSAGTYIRTLTLDLVEVLGCGACLSFLLRTQAGMFSLREALTLPEIKAAVQAGTLADRLCSLEQALSRFPAVHLHPSAARSVASGARLYLPGVLTYPMDLALDSLVRLVCENKVIAMGKFREIENELCFQPVKGLVDALSLET